VPLAATLTPGEQHESTQVAPVLRRVRLSTPGHPGRPRTRPHTRPHTLAGEKDKGDSFPTVRRFLPLAAPARPPRRDPDAQGPAPEFPLRPRHVPAA
jgi:hypothetical protein